MTLPAIFLGHGSPMNAIDPASRYNRGRRNSPRASANCWQDTRCTPTPTAAWTTALGRCCATSIPKPTYRSSNLA